MTKQSQYMQGYEQGLISALKTVQKDGIQGLEDEIKFRNITELHTNMSKQDVNNLVQEVKSKIVRAYMILSFASLHDFFGYGHKRCKKFWDGVDMGAGYLCNDVATWDDYSNSIEEQLGFEIDTKDL